MGNDDNSPVIMKPELALRVGELALARAELRHSASHDMSLPLHHTGLGAARVQLRGGRSTGTHYAETLNSV